MRGECFSKKWKLIVVTNREPYIVKEVKKGISKARVEKAVGGVTAALDPIMQELKGKWIAWGSTKAAKTVVNGKDRVWVPLKKPKYMLRYIWLTQSEVRNYYYGFSNRAIWPLCHLFHHKIYNPPKYWKSYLQVNRKFANAVLEESGKDDLIWVHDYQLSLVPRLMREKRKDAKIAMFWHIPFPPYEVFSTLPQRGKILLGMLGSDLIGFHSPTYAINFRRCVEEVLGLRTQKRYVIVDERRVYIKALPLGVDYEGLNQQAASLNVVKRMKQARKAIGENIIAVSLDRLDYTKGIRHRLQGIETFFDKYKQYLGRISFIQCASPSRTKVAEYRTMKREVDENVGRINAKYLEEGWIPIRYFYRILPYEQILAYFRVADILLVTPLIDGMNLVAKEYLSVTEKGIVVISEFAGAAKELGEAIKINPYDREEIADAIKAAIEMPTNEKQRRLRALKQRVKRQDSMWWTKEFLNHWVSLYS